MRVPPSILSSAEPDLGSLASVAEFSYDSLAPEAVTATVKHTQSYIGVATASDAPHFASDKRGSDVVKDERSPQSLQLHETHAGPRNTPFES